MKTCTIKIYDRLVPDVAQIVRRIAYNKATEVTNAIALFNNKRPSKLATVKF